MKGNNLVGVVYFHKIIKNKIMKKVLKVLIKFFPIFVIVGVFIATYFIGYYSDGAKKGSDFMKNIYKSCEVYVKTGVYPNYEGNTQEFLDRFAPWNDCEKMLSTYKRAGDSAFQVWDYVYMDCYFLLTCLIVFFVIFPVIYKCSKEFKAKHIKSVILREKYSKYISKIFLNAYKSVWFVPVVLILNFAFCYLVTGHVDIRQAPEEAEIYYSISYYIAYFLTIILYMLVTVNLALIVSSRNKNVIISIIETLLITFFVVYNIEMAGGRLFDLGVVSSEDYFWALNILNPSFYRMQSLYIFVIIPFITFILTFIVAVAAFTDKEKLIQMCEK